MAFVTESAGPLTALVVVFVQPLAPVTVTVYQFGTQLIMAAAVAPLLQRYVYGVTPPVVVAVAVALLLVVVVALTEETDSVMAVGCVILTDVTVVAAPEVTVTV